MIKANFGEEIPILGLPKTDCFSLGDIPVTWERLSRIGSFRCKVVLNNSHLVRSFDAQTNLKRLWIIEVALRPKRRLVSV